MMIFLLLLCMGSFLYAAENQSVSKILEVQLKLWQEIEKQPPINQSELRKKSFDFDDENPDNPWAITTYCKKQKKKEHWLAFDKLEGGAQTFCFNSFLFWLDREKNKYKYTRCLVAMCIKNVSLNDSQMRTDIRDLISTACDFNDKKILSLVQHDARLYSWLFDNIFSDIWENARTVDIARLLEPSEIRPTPDNAHLFDIMGPDYESDLLNYSQAKVRLDPNLLSLVYRPDNFDDNFRGSILHKLILNAKEHSLHELQRKFEWITRNCNHELFNEKMKAWDGKEKSEFALKILNKTAIELATLLAEKDPESQQLRYIQQALIKHSNELITSNNSNT